MPWICGSPSCTSSDPAEQSAATSRQTGTGQTLWKNMRKTGENMCILPPSRLSAVTNFALYLLLYAKEYPVIINCFRIIHHIYKNSARTPSRLSHTQRSVDNTGENHTESPQKSAKNNTHGNKSALIVSDRQRPEDWLCRSHASAFCGKS